MRLLLLALLAISTHRTTTSSIPSGHAALTATLRQLSSSTISSQITGLTSSTLVSYAGLSSTDYSQSGGGSNNDDDCQASGLAFVGISFSSWDFVGSMREVSSGVDYFWDAAGLPRPSNECSFYGIDYDNPTYGNPGSYQLNEQMPFARTVDRSFEYFVTADLDGWLVGGAYGFGDPSGYANNPDSSHTELFRFGSMDESLGGVSITSIYEFMALYPPPPIKTYITGVKCNNNGNCEIELDVVSEYLDDGGDLPDWYDGSYDLYSSWSNLLLAEFSGYACADGGTTNPHISTLRGATAWSAQILSDYLYAGNLAVAQWQAAYEDGVYVGTSENFCLVDDVADEDGNCWTGYGFMTMFYGRGVTTAKFETAFEISEDETYISQMYKNGEVCMDGIDATVDWDTSGSGGGGADAYDCSSFDGSWQTYTEQFVSDRTIPCNCYADGYAFIGVPMAMRHEMTVRSWAAGGETAAFQSCYDFQELSDYGHTYHEGMGTNHGWLAGHGCDYVSNPSAYMQESDHITVGLFGLGHLSEEKGGLSISTVLKVIQSVSFDTGINLKPAFVYLDSNNSPILQWESTSDSQLAKIYDSLCGLMGNPASGSPSAATNYCARSMASDVASNGCTLDGLVDGSTPGNGGFCLNSILALGVKWHSAEYAQSYLEMANGVVDSWRSQYPDGCTPEIDSSLVSGEGSHSGCIGVFYNSLSPAFLQCPGGKQFTVLGESQWSSSFSWGSGPVTAADVGFDGSLNSAVIGKVAVWLVALGMAGVGLFAAGVGARKFRRRSKKGLNEYEILFGTAKKGSERGKRSSSAGKGKRERGRGDRKGRKSGSSAAGSSAASSGLNSPASSPDERFVMMNGQGDVSHESEVDYSEMTPDGTFERDRDIGLRNELKREAERKARKAEKKESRRRKEEQERARKEGRKGGAGRAGRREKVREEAPNSFVV